MWGSGGTPFANLGLDSTYAPVPGGTMHPFRKLAHFRNPKRCPRGLAILAASLGFAASCGLEKPQTPNWDVDLLVPIASRHLDGPYLAAHSGTEYLRWHPDSGLVWTVRTGLDPVTLAGHLVTAPPPSTGDFPLGSINVGENEVLSSIIALEDVAPLTAGVVPDIAASIDAGFTAAATFDSLSGADGILRLEIENELGVSIDQVAVTLYSAAGPIAVIAVPGAIPTGETRLVDHAISNLSCGDDWSTNLSLHTPGGTVLSAADKYVAVRATFPDGMTATYARGVIDPMIREYEDSFSLSDKHKLSTAFIAEGQLTLGWTNSTPLPVTVSWFVPELSIAGSPLSGQTVFAPNSSSSLPINLAGAVFLSSHDNSVADVNVTVQTAGSNGQMVAISGSQTVGYSLAWSPLTLASATGEISPTVIETGLLSTSVDWEAGLEDAGLDQWSAELLVTSSLPIPAELNGHVTLNTGLDLPFSGTVPAATSGLATVRLPLATGSAPLQPLPSQISCEGTVVFGGNTLTMSVSEDDFVTATVQFNAPSHVYVDDVKLEIEPTSVALSGEDFGDRTGRLKSAVITVNASNGFPLGGQITLRLATDSAGLYAPNALTLGPSTLAPALSDASGYAVSASTTQLTYTLDSADLTLFEREVIWLAELLELTGPGNGQPARISATDALDWNAQARIEFNVDEDVRPWED